MGRWQGFRSREISAQPRFSVFSPSSAHSCCTFQLAELIHTPPSLMTLISAKDEPKQKAPKEKKAHLWAPPPQHNFLKNWQRNIALRRKQQEALSGEQGGPGSRLASVWHQGSAVSFLSLYLSRACLFYSLPSVS